MRGLRSRVELHDIQGNVLRSYGFDHAAYVFAHVSDAQAGRRWIRELADRTTTAEVWPEGGKPALTVNVAFTWAGLRAVGLGDDALVSFPAEFRAGMKARAGLLGDVGPSSPDCWDDGLRDGRAHVLVTLHAQRADVLDDAVRELRDRLAWPDGGLAHVHDERAEVLPFGREHFGFEDGFAQPAVRGSGAAPLPGQGAPARFGRWRPLKTGEFVLGLEDEDGQPSGPPDGALGRNGTFMVWRKLRQDVPAFRRYLRDAARGYPGGEELLAAKIVGRWRDGTPLVLSPAAPDPAISGDRMRINDFRYGGDPEGLRCPLGAHIRRANPRDALGFRAQRTVRHRIQRRGMPYGPPLPEGVMEDDGHERGLIFVCANASIARQFEVVQAQWCFDGNPFGLGHDRDFLIADGDGSGKMTIQGSPPLFLAPQPTFVTTRGGDYLFVPGLRTLRALAQGVAGLDGG